jgi:hypothetical protein
MTAKLLFASGFEAGVKLGPVQSGSQQTLSGIDSGTGFAWPPNVWGGGAALQRLDGSFVNQIQTVIGHNGTPTHVLFQDVTHANASDTQDPLLFTPTAPLAREGDLYTSEWIKFQPDLATQLISGQNPDGSWGNWRVLFEWKTGGQGANFGGDYRVKISVEKDNSGHLFWSTAGDNNANGPYPFRTFWQTDNHTVPVVAGQWFHLETFTHRSAGAGGEFWAKVNGKTIVDHVGPNIGVADDPINRIMLAQDYTGGHLPASQWVDDVQLWNGAPAQASAAISPAAAVAAAVASTPAPTPVPTIPTPTAQGSQTLVLHVSEHAWMGDAQFTVTVDGRQLGGVHTATASHAMGQWQDVSLTGDFGPHGPSQVAVHYIDDASGGTAATDRNLYVSGIEVNGHHFAGAAAANTASLGHADPSATDLLVDGTVTFDTAGSAKPAPPPAQTIVLHVAEDAWHGDAQFTVKVDGTQIGGVHTPTASHAAGHWQDVVLAGDFAAKGPGEIAVDFINDASGATGDRNLYVQGIEVNGHHFAGASATDTASLGHTDPGSAHMLINGALTFHLFF